MIDKPYGSKMDGAVSGAACFGAPKVSVVLPVYNVAEHIGQCIDSLKSQTFKALEFIFVDDASTDDSALIIEDFAAEDGRVRLIRNEKNMGAGPTRNAGIAAAQGEFVSFVDPDDHAAPDFYEKLYKKASEEKLDIAKGRIVYEFEDGTPAEHVELNDRIRKGLESDRPLFCLFTYQHQSAIYRLAPIQEYGITYGSARRSQDTTFLLRACHRLTKIGFDESAEYFFKERMNSTMHNLKPHTLGWNIDALREQVDYIAAEMRDEPCAAEYSSRTLTYLCKLCEFIGARHGAEKVEKYAADLRDIALHVPGLERIKQSSFPIRALCDHSRILPNEPFKLPWQGYDPEDCIRVLKLWTDFLSEHRECSNAMRSYLVHLFNLAVSAAEKTPGRGKAQLREIDAIKKRLPLSHRLRMNRCAKMLLSLKNVFSASSSRVQQSAEFQTKTGKIKGKIKMNETCRGTDISSSRADAPKVSVILPVYNVAKLIGRCIDSLRNQTLKELEFIFVDDVSPDDSVRHIEAFAAEDGRVRLIRNEKNMGPGPSRNVGIAAARGEFVSFVDPDDRIDPKFCEKLYKKASEEKLDIAKGRIVYEFEDGCPSRQFGPNDRIREGLREHKPLYTLFTYQHQSAIFRLASIREYGIMYGTTRRSEDTTFLLRACHRLTSIGIDERAEYFMIEHHGSLTHDLSPETLEWNIDGLREKLDYIAANMSDEPNIGQYAMLRLCYACRLYDRVAALHGSEKVKKYTAALRELALRAPHIEKIKQDSVTIRALCDYSRILPNTLFKLPWEENDPQEFVRVLELWLDFLDEHPECKKAAKDDLLRLFAGAERSAKNAPGGGKDRLREINALKKRLPLSLRIRMSWIGKKLHGLKSVSSAAQSGAKRAPDTLHEKTQ